jgi:hypothetical protein
MKILSERDLVIVFASEPVEANLVRNFLESNGIPAVLNNELMGTLAPFQISPGGAGAVKVLVSKKRAYEAKALIRSFSKS